MGGCGGGGGFQFVAFILKSPQCSFQTDITIQESLSSEDHFTSVTFIWRSPHQRIRCPISVSVFTLNRGLPPTAPARRANSDSGLLLPKADTGRLAIVCVLGYTHTHTHTRTHAHTHTNTHTQTHARTHTHTHTYTYTQTILK